MKYYVAAVGMLLSVNVAFGADLPRRVVKPTPPVAPFTPVFDWSGPYIGLHAGYGWGHERDDQSALFPPTTGGGGNNGGGGGGNNDKLHMSGFVGGLHAGYNYRINQFVVGVEGDLDYAGLRGSGFAVYPGPTPRSYRLNSDWQGSLRLRAGYAIDNLLIYTTGGVAFAHANLNVNGFEDSNNHVGWTVGLGAEYAFTQNWLGRVEVRYSDFAKKSYQTIDGPVKAGWNQTTLNVGISYKF